MDKKEERRPPLRASSGHDSIIPTLPNAEAHQLTKDLSEKVLNLLNKYVDAMEKVSKQF
ncbi:hypothetical protein HPP92_019908 [Vanilla planifolia]|uniref:Uncharacterized protein n=1 Tax=Vanilla planifolia TaxID=51239 RepID=A0A835UJS0_VANPL|nr:hypothetical protein HPP92_019908 [Vanilla planifolia]